LFFLNFQKTIDIKIKKEYYLNNINIENRRERVVGKIRMILREL